jgi:hypothetical protein
MDQAIKQEIKIEDVMCVYSGKEGRCMCGCAGKYTYREETREIGSKDRGYPVKDEDIDNARVQRVINKINRNAFTRELNHAFVVIGQTIYCAYMIKKN